MTTLHLSTIPKELVQSAKLLVKEDCILAGVELAEIIFKTFDKDLKVEVFIKDGENAKSWRHCFHSYWKVSVDPFYRKISAKLHAKNEWNCNFYSTDWDSRLIGNQNQTCLTRRKTTPNFRICEKWAVAIGGGTNHRYGLYDMIMLKDNHIDYNGSITNAAKTTTRLPQKK